MRTFMSMQILKDSFKFSMIIFQKIGSLVSLLLKTEMGFFRLRNTETNLSLFGYCQIEDNLLELICTTVGNFCI
jgi:hypothetical protein